MKRIDEEIQMTLKAHEGNVRQALADNHRLDYLYALSDVRELLLEWYDFDPDARLLQVGADYGAMTRLYQSVVAHVTVLDTEEKSLETVRMRYAGAENVICVRDSLAGYGERAELPYDYVVMIGMEKAPDEGDIRAAKKLLKPDGVLIVAVSNPLGMKYWAGTRREDNGLTKGRLEELLGKENGKRMPKERQRDERKLRTGEQGEGQPKTGERDEGATGTERNQPASEENQPGFFSFYYPMPDYRTPIAIYSDEYLPKKGDLTRTIPAYDYPRYHVMDMGEGFDVVCEDGLFDLYANSYLVFWSRDPRRLDVANRRIFIKYNKTRKDEFQIKTCICRGDIKDAASIRRALGQSEPEMRERKEEDGIKTGYRPEIAEGRYVEKAALSLKGMGHIWSFEEKHLLLSQQHRALKVAAPEYRDDKNAAFFPYLTGQTWAEKLGEELSRGEIPLRLLKDAIGQIYDMEPEYRGAFVRTEEFLEVFGQELSEEELALLEADTTCRVSNIDALFENILLTEDGNYCLDYEWVFTFPVPEHFVKYRILYYFCEQYGSLMGKVGTDEILAAFDITGEMVQVYEKMEVSFQNYVHGENKQLYLGNYMVSSLGSEEIRRAESDLARARERIEQMKIHAREKDVTIRKMTEVQRLTNNHVTNLEIMIKDLRHEIDEMGKTLAYLNRHEALVFKVKRKLGEQVNKKYPPGSLERKKLKYKKEYLLHPIRSARRYTTQEGKNLRDGDFHIGDIYRQHGKLRFERQENPAVSIVIPVYNQIHYTYACLLSIWEHTKNVAYEILIADDVSTDATERLGDFAEGLVICRNKENQGFLRNCNQAAEKARGKYIMFLNNDTQVTEGWLSSLVRLIESDDTIGMVGSKLVYPDGRLQEAGGIIWSDGSGWNYGRLDDPDKPEYNYVKDVDYISGAAILLPVWLWKQIGGFDTRFAPAYCEDSDLAFEVRRAGYRVVYQPLSKVIHFEGVSNGTDVEGTGLKRYQVENSRKLKEKWAAEFACQCENNGNPDPFRARERSMGKPIILVVDHYVPTYDRDAGSKTTFQYLKMFLKKGYVVKFLGDNFLHEEPYSTVLLQMGIEILYGAEYQVKIWDWLRDHGDDIAVAYLNRPHIASKYIDYILDNTDMKVIYYGHDLHFLREGREYQLTGDLKKREEAEYWKSIELSLMSKASVSYYPSYVERDAIRAMDPTIAVKDITAYVFDEFKENLQEDFAKREGFLFVGGFAHPPNADAVLWFAKEIYPKIRRQMEAAGQQAPEFVVVGSKVTEEIRALEQPGNGIVIKGFVTEEELDRLYGECRIVVVPLRYGAGVKGKVVEAIYNGAPIVTTAIGAEGIPHAKDVLLVEDEPDSFARAVVRLYLDPDGCRELCHKTQAYIRENFSVDGAWKRIEEDFSVTVHGAMSVSRTRRCPHEQ